MNAIATFGGHGAGGGHTTAYLTYILFFKKNLETNGTDSIQTFNLTFAHMVTHLGS